MSNSWKELVELGKSATDTLKHVYNVLASVALYVTVALVVALIIYHALACRKGADTEAKARKFELGVAVGYSIGVLVTLGALKLLREILKGEIGKEFWLVMGLLALVAAAIIVVSVLSKRKSKHLNLIVALFAIAVIAYAVVILLVIPAEEGYSPDNPVLMYVLSAILVAIALVSAVVLDKSSAYDARSLTYAAICVATSFALSYVKFFTVGAQGGSVTFASLLPLALYSYMFGIRKGLVAGVVYGLLQLVQSPQIYHPMQVLLDYPIAFGMIGLAGIGKKFKFLKNKIFAQFAMGMTIAALLRYAAHSVSGYFVFSSWAWEGYAPLAYSLVYNLFVLVDAAVVICVSAFVFAPKSVRRMVLSVGNLEQTEPLGEENK